MTEDWGEVRNTLCVNIQWWRIIVYSYIQPCDVLTVHSKALIVLDISMVKKCCALTHLSWGTICYYCLADLLRTGSHSSSLRQLTKLTAPCSWGTSDWRGASSRSPGLHTRGPVCPRAAWRSGSCWCRVVSLLRRCSPLPLPHCPLSLSQGREKEREYTHSYWVPHTFSLVTQNKGQLSDLSHCNTCTSTFRRTDITERVTYYIRYRRIGFRPSYWRTGLYRHCTEWGSGFIIYCKQLHTCTSPPALQVLACI